MNKPTLIVFTAAFIVTFYFKREFKLLSKLAVIKPLITPKNKAASAKMGIKYITPV